MFSFFPLHQTSFPTPSLVFPPPACHVQQLKGHGKWWQHLDLDLKLAFGLVIFFFYFLFLVEGCRVVLEFVLGFLVIWA